MSLAVLQFSRPWRDLFRLKVRFPGAESAGLLADAPPGLDSPVFWLHRNARQLTQAEAPCYFQASLRDWIIVVTLRMATEPLRVYSHCKLALVFPVHG